MSYIRTAVATVAFAQLPSQWCAMSFHNAPVRILTPSLRLAGFPPPLWRMRRSAERLDGSEDTSSTQLYSPPSLQVPLPTPSSSMDGNEYRRGIGTVGFITLLFASKSPVVHAAFSSGGDTESLPPVLLLNALVSAVACAGLLVGGLGEFLESKTPLPSSLRGNVSGIDEEKSIDKDRSDDMQGGLRMLARSTGVEVGGVELGIWKTLGTTANLYGLSLTSANHGALLVQLTTLLVPLAQGATGVPIPRRIMTSVVLALAGIVVFTQDHTAGTNGINAATPTGDALCVLAAVFHAAYDLRLFEWGRRAAPRALIASKIATQAALSAVLLLAVGGADAAEFCATASPDTLAHVGGVALWCGLAVNAVASFLQVGGQQAIGATRAQTLYASQPLWAAAMSWVFLGEGIGVWGAVGGMIFMAAVLLAATAEAPDPNCDEPVCEV